MASEANRPPHPRCCSVWIRHQNFQCGVDQFNSQKYHHPNSICWRRVLLLPVIISDRECHIHLVLSGSYGKIRMLYLLGAGGFQNWMLNCLAKKLRACRINMPIYFIFISVNSSTPSINFDIRLPTSCRSGLWSEGGTTEVRPLHFVLCCSWSSNKHSPFDTVGNYPLIFFGYFFFLSHLFSLGDYSSASIPSASEIVIFSLLFLHLRAKRFLPIFILNLC